MHALNTFTVYATNIPYQCIYVCFRVYVSVIYVCIHICIQVLVTSHLGRPKGGYEAKFSLAPVAPRLAQLLGVSVPLVPDCIGMAVSKHVLSMKVSVCMLCKVCIC